MYYVTVWPLSLLLRLFFYLCRLVGINVAVYVTTSSKDDPALTKVGIRLDRGKTFAGLILFRKGYDVTGTKVF